MAPPTTTIRLATLDPLKVATEVCAVILEQRERQTFALSPALDPPDPAAAIEWLRLHSLAWATALESETAREIAMRAFGMGWQSHDAVTAEQLATSSDLGLIVQQLTHYARDGALGDWSDATCASDAVQTVCAVLYPGSRVIPEDHDEIGRVIRAALARAAIDTGQPVSLVGLEALAGVAKRTVRLAIYAGELRPAKGARGSVTAKSATAWLAARGVAGFVSQSAA